MASYEVQTEGGTFQVDTDEPEDSAFSTAAKNFIPDAKNMVKGMGAVAGRVGKGIIDAPSDLLYSATGISLGQDPTTTPIAEDFKTMGRGAIDAVKSIPKSLGNLASGEEWTQHPAQNLTTAASVAFPFLKALRGGSALEAAGAIKPKPIIPAEVPIAPVGEAAINLERLRGAPEAAEAAIPKTEPPPVPTPSEPPTSQPLQDIPKSAPRPVEDILRNKTDSGMPTPPPKEVSSDPLQELKDFVSKKYGEVASQPGRVEKTANYLKEEAQNMRGKDIGLQLGQVKGMGPGFIGNEKAGQLLDYAGEKGYFKPTLSDVERKMQIKKALSDSGKNLGALRDIVSKRGVPPVQAITDAVKNELTEKYGVKAPNEIARVLDLIKQRTTKNPTFSGLADLATELNADATPVTKMAQHPGPTTDAANIVGRMSNDAARGLMNESEKKAYTQNLRDYGAHKKLEQAVAAADRKRMVGRGAPGSLSNRLYQEALDRGGYRFAGNVANRVSDAMTKNPAKFKSLPEFFEELAHHSGAELEDMFSGDKGMSEGGLVTPEIEDFIKQKTGARR